jgi:hypothetical protein
MVGPSTYRFLWRLFPCERCYAMPGQKCRGFRGRVIQDCHLQRKQKCAEWRQDNPNMYRMLRDDVAEYLQQK